MSEAVSSSFGNHWIHGDDYSGMELRLLSVFSLVGSLVFGMPALADGHAHPKKKSFPAGSRATIAFEVGHGCDGSPTVQVAVRLPDGVTDPTPKNPTKWTSSVEKNVVTWKGGPLSAKTKGTFELTVTLPTVKGALSFPFVQTCSVGALRWVEGPKSKYPAPVITLT